MFSFSSYNETAMKLFSTSLPIPPFSYNSVFLKSWLMQAPDHHLCSFISHAFLVPSNDVLLIQLKAGAALFMMVAQ